MKCPKCDVEMIVSKAIKPVRENTCLAIMQVVPSNHKTIKLIDCWKCPKCGHSDDGK